MNSSDMKSSRTYAHTHTHTHTTHTHIHTHSHTYIMANVKLSSFARNLKSASES